MNKNKYFTLEKCPKCNGRVYVRRTSDCECCLFAGCEKCGFIRYVRIFPK